jgi:hypothetical protein
MEARVSVRERQRAIVNTSARGYRTLVAADGQTLRCYSRNGLDWTHRFGAVPRAIPSLAFRWSNCD